MARGAEGLRLSEPSVGPAGAGGGTFHRLLTRAVDVQPDEVRAVVASFVYFFFALSSWFVLRPMRDTVAASSGATQLSWLWVGTLGTMLVANAAFSAVVVKFPPRKFIPYAYHAIEIGRAHV